jgi:hypothetical protein
MGDQQVNLLERMNTLAINAKLGDGHYWRHPECVNDKILFTSTDPGLLQAKVNLAPDLFPSGVKVIRKAGEVKGVTKNAKTLYVITSRVSPIFTQFRHMNILDILPRLTIRDFGLWYLDDGCCIYRNDHPNPGTYRFRLCIGRAGETQELCSCFMDKIASLFPNEHKLGRVHLNNSKDSERNKTWAIPVKIARCIMDSIKDFYIIPHKFPYEKTPETISL